MRGFLALLPGLLLTLAVELPVLWLCGWRRGSDQLAALCANVITNLPLNLLFSLVLPRRFWLVLLLEAGVVAVEYGIYRRILGRERPRFWPTLLTNALSFGLGLLLWPAAAGL